MNRYVIIIIVLALVLGAVVWLKPDVLESVRQGFGQQAQLEAQASQFALEHAQDFALYRHAGAMNFTMRYPIGYLVDEEESENLTVQFAAYSQEATAEVINVRASPFVYSESEILAGFEELRRQGAGDLSQSTSLINGRRVFVVSAQLQEPNSGDRFTFVHTTFPQCDGENGGAYSATITASIPQGLEDDLETVNYMIHSFNC